MKIDVQVDNDLAIIKMEGNLVGGPESDELNAKIHSLLDDDIKQIILNLQDVKWMNSAGLGMLVTCLATVKNSSGRMKLAGISRKIESLLVITQLNRVFETYDNVEQARASMIEE